VVQQLRGENLRDAIRSLIGEAVLSTKDASARGRQAAFEVLVRMTNRANEAGDGFLTIADVLSIIPAGLAGATPHMISACVLAMSRLLYECVHLLPPQAVADTIRTVSLLLQHKAREVLKPVIGFMKVAVVCMPHELLMTHLQEIVRPILMHALMI